MCGRYMLTSPLDAVSKLFDVIAGFNLQPRYNIAPLQPVMVVRETGSGRELTPMEWGFIPSWAKERRTDRPLINARGETLAEKPSFKSSYKRRRCLLPANGFYEWSAGPDGKLANLIQCADRPLMAFAGIWDMWHGVDGGDELETVAIVTGPANAAIAPLHDRMPVIVEPAQFDLWLTGEGTNPLPQLHAPEADRFSIAPVSRRLNNVRNEGAELLVPDVPTQGQLL